MLARSAFTHACWAVACVFPLPCSLSFWAEQKGFFLDDAADSREAGVMLVVVVIEPFLPAYCHDETKKYSSLFTGLHVSAVPKWIY